MKKSELLNDLIKTINIYSCYVEKKPLCEIEKYDLSYYDKTNELTDESADYANKIDGEFIGKSPYFSNKNNTQLYDENEKEDKTNIKSKTYEMLLYSKTIKECKACSLCSNSFQRIPGFGNVKQANIFVICPPIDINAEKFGRPLAKNEFEFFEKWINSINLKFDQLFITNILKCNWLNREIKIDYIKECMKHLDKQLEIINPEVILSLGQITLSSLKMSKSDINSEHGKVIKYKNWDAFPIFDPLTVLNDTSLKKPLWEDLKKFKSLFLDK